MSADKAVVPKDQEQAKKEGGKAKVVGQEGGTIYIGFEKGYARGLLFCLLHQTST